MTPTEIAAWWGAGVATIVFAWDIYKWVRTGPIIKVSTATNMESFGGTPDGLEGRNLIVVEVTNSGSSRTTITHFFGSYYNSRLRKIRKKADRNFLVPNPGTGQPIPYVLEPGERWLGCIEQTEELEKMSREGYLYCGVYHSCRKAAVVQRVIVQDKRDTK